MNLIILFGKQLHFSSYVKGFLITIKNYISNCITRGGADFPIYLNNIVDKYFWICSLAFAKIYCYRPNR